MRDTAARSSSSTNSSFAWGFCAPIPMFTVCNPLKLSLLASDPPDEKSRSSLRARTSPVNSTRSGTLWMASPAQMRPRFAVVPTGLRVREEARHEF
jgi:hypothetical protein